MVNHDVFYAVLSTRTLSVLLIGTFLGRLYFCIPRCSPSFRARCLAHYPRLCLLIDFGVSDSIRPFCYIAIQSCSTKSQEHRSPPSIISRCWLTTGFAPSFLGSSHTLRIHFSGFFSAIRESEALLVLLIFRNVLIPCCTLSQSKVPTYTSLRYIFCHPHERTLCPLLKIEICSSLDR